MPRGGAGGGGHGPRAQALEGAPAQLVGANFKSRGNFNLAKVAYILWAPRSLCIMGSFFSFSCRRPFFFNVSDMGWVVYGVGSVWGGECMGWGVYGVGSVWGGECMGWGVYGVGSV